MAAIASEHTARSGLPEGYTLRPGRLEDAPAIARLMEAHSASIDGQDSSDEGRIRREWQTPGFDPEQDTCVVVAPDGEIVGVEEVWNLAAPYVHPFAWGRVHPTHRGRGIGTALLRWAEARLRASLDRAPAGARVTMVTGFNLLDTSAPALMEALGLKVDRYFLRMQIDFDGPPDPPRWPEGITVRAIAPGEEERAAYQVVRESFRDHYGWLDTPFEEAYQRWLHYHLDEDYDPSLRFLALEGERIVGVSMCNPHAYDDRRLGWIATLGVLREARRRGLGEALLRHSLGEFYRRGCPGAALTVDADSLTGATRLYEKAGMRTVRRYVNYELELRPGRELRTESAAG